MKKTNIIITNCSAKFNYEILNEFQAGIKLEGSEVKPTKNGKASIKEAFCTFKDNELFITNMNITNYDNSSGFFAHEAIRDRKLLLKKKELQKLQSEVQVKGLTIVPLKLIKTDKGYLKLIIGLCRGKKNFDKRLVEKERTLDKELKQLKKDY